MGFFAPFAAGRRGGSRLGRQGPRHRLRSCACSTCSTPSARRPGARHRPRGGDGRQLNAELAAKGNRNAEAHVGDAEDLDLPDGLFDVVTGGFKDLLPARPAAGPPGAAPGAGRRAAPLPCRSSTDPVRLPVDGRYRTELFGPSPPMPNEEFNEAAVLDDALVAAGFTRPLATDVIERFRFADAGQVEAMQPRRPPAARPLRRPIGSPAAAS